MIEEIDSIQELSHDRMSMYSEIHFDLWIFNICTNDQKFKI